MRWNNKIVIWLYLWNAHDSHFYLIYLQHWTSQFSVSDGDPEQELSLQDERGFEQDRVRVKIPVPVLWSQLHLPQVLQPLHWPVNGEK